MVLLLPLLLAQVEMARLLVLLTLALQLEATAQWIAELAMDGVGVVSAPGVATVTTELLDTKAKKSVPVVSNDAVKKQLQDDTKKMTDEPPEGLRANLRPAYLQAVLRRQAGLHHQALRVQGAAARLQRHGLRHLEGMARAVPGRVRGGAVQGAALLAPEPSRRDLRRHHRCCRRRCRRCCCCAASA